MSDTIDLLETIGKNASLRHASAQELADTLAQADASEALKAAAMAGDSSLLSVELGNRPMIVNHDTHTAGRDDDEEQELEGEEESGPAPESEEN